MLYPLAVVAPAEALGGSTSDWSKKEVEGGRFRQAAVVVGGTVELVTVFVIEKFNRS